MESARREIDVRELRTALFRTTLNQACSGNLDVLIGFETRVPALPPRPLTCRKRKQPRSTRTSGSDRRENRKQKRSSSRAPKGAKRSASRTETGDVEDRSSRTERSRRPEREWPRSCSVSRRRSESRPPVGGNRLPGPKSS